MEEKQTTGTNIMEWFRNIFGGNSEEATEQTTAVAVVDIGGNTEETEAGFPFLLAGVIAGMLVVSAVVFFLLRRRKRAEQWDMDASEEMQVEKTIAGNEEWEEDAEKTTYSPLYNGEEEDEYPVTVSPDFAPVPAAAPAAQPAAAPAAQPAAAPAAQPAAAAAIPVQTVVPAAKPVPQPEPPEPEEPVMAETEMINPTYNHPVFRIGHAATIGGRSEQQDALYCSNWKDDAILSHRGMLAAVADGIGGLKGGSLASSSAMASMQSNFSRNVFPYSGSNKLLSLVGEAHTAVLRLNQSGMNCGCTLVTVLIEGWNMYLASVGDSRIYLYRAGGLIVLNREHTLGRENADRMEMGRESIPPENLKKAKALTSYLGKSSIKLVDRTLTPIRLLPGDKIALMSDGIFGTLSEEEMLATIRKDAETAAKEMVASIDARHNPRQDNATVVIISVE